MLNFDKQISRLEEFHGAKNNIASAVKLALRYWQASRFSLSETYARTLLQRANHTTLTAHRRNTSHAELFALTIFIAIEAGHYDSANEMLDKVMGYRSFLRTNAPHQYAVMCFLYAYLEINQKRARSAKKYWRLLTDHIRSVEPHPDYSIMQGLLHLASDEFGDAYGFLREAFRNGSGSIFMYEGLYRFYRKTPHKPEGGAILAVLIYAAERGVDITSLALQHQDALFNAVSLNPEAGEHLYKISGYPPLLQEICAHRIAKNDMSLTAYNYYKEAESKQIVVDGLFRAIVHAAYENKASHINHYALAQFFTPVFTPGGHSRLHSDELLAAVPKPDADLFAAGEMNVGERFMSTGLAIYVYNLLLTTPSLEELLPERQSHILQLAADCIEAGITGREVNSLYYYFWQRCRVLGVTGINLNRVEEILSRELTLFEVVASRDSAARYIYITEPEKRGMIVCDMLLDGANLIIEASGQSVSYTCLGAGQRAILDEKLTIRRMIPGAGAELYQHFFNKGDRRFYLLTFLTNHYLNQESPPDAAIPVFEAMLAEKAITKAYRMRILVALGQLHYNAFSFDQALECYGEIDEDALENDFTWQILSVYMQTGEADRAVKLLSKKHSFIAGDVLLDTILTLLAKPIDHAPLAEAAYKLLLGGHYHPELLTLVLDHYRASYREWVALWENIKDTRLDTRILETALWMACWDINIQRAFVRLHVSGCAGELTAQFVEFATFKLLADAVCLEYDTLEILEQLRDEMLTLGLASCYLQYNVTTHKSEEILADAMDILEKSGILLPVFKEKKFARIPFIEKLQPFVYRGLPGKDYRLNYCIDDANTFIQMPMRYVKYGLYIACLPVFYNEEVAYFFSEEMPTGSIATKTETLKNIVPFLHDHPTDRFFAINNAITYEQMFKHDQVEKTVGTLVKDVQAVRSGLM